MSSFTVTAAYAKANLGALLDRVARGERVVILRYNRPVADLGPAAAETRPLPKLGTGKGKVKIVDPNWAAPLSDEQMDEWLK